MLLPFFYLWKMVSQTSCMLQHLKMADGIAIAGWVTGRCYYHIGRLYSPQVNCFILSFEVLNRTSSQICGRRYLPMFLFRDGLLTLIYRTSFMFICPFKWNTFPSQIVNGNEPLLKILQVHGQII